MLSSRIFGVPPSPEYIARGRVTHVFVAAERVSAPDRYP
jgi:hypothetical protein